MTQSQKIPTYCRDCGSPFIHKIVRADQVKVDEYCFGGVTRNFLASRYDRHTGKENLADIYSCPHHRRYWLLGSNSHDRIISYNGDLYYD